MIGCYQRNVGRLQFEVIAVHTAYTNSPRFTPLPWTWARQWALLSSCSLSSSLRAHALLLAAPLWASPTLASLPKRQPEFALAAVVDRVRRYPDRIWARSFSVASRPLAKPSAATLWSARRSSRSWRSLLASCQAPNTQVRMLPNLSNLRTRGPVCPSSTLWYLVSRSASGLLYSSGIRLALFSSPPAFCSLP